MAKTKFEAFIRRGLSALTELALHSWAGRELTDERWDENVRVLAWFLEDVLRDADGHRYKVRRQVPVDLHDEAGTSQGHANPYRVAIGGPAVLEEDTDQAVLFADVEEDTSVGTNSQE